MIRALECTLLDYFAISLLPYYLNKYPPAEASRHAYVAAQHQIEERRKHLKDDHLEDEIVEAIDGE